MRGGTAIYNSYRPKSWSEVIGQPQAIDILRKQGQLGAWGHAYLLYGASGTGKTTTARILAAALNCTKDGTGEPCGKCQSCRTILDAANWDVIELDAGQFRGIDDIRELRTKAYFSPIGKRKVYIIDEAHQLTETAWNGLLKLLEEPPPHLVIILCTTQADKIPLTVKSRCQLFPFNALKPDQIKGKLARIAQDWGIELDPKHLEFIAQSAGGNMRAAENLLEQCIVVKA